MRLLSLMVVASLLVACNGKEPASPPPRPTPTQSSKAIKGGPGCRLPRRKPLPGWLPRREVPLPRGTYLLRSLAHRTGFDRALFVMRIDTAAFRDFVDTVWLRAGVTTLRPDQEPGEVEALFTTSRATGLFKANDVICKPPYARLLLVYQR